MLKVFVASTDIADISKEMVFSEYRARKIEATGHEAFKRERMAAAVLLSYALKRGFGLDERTLEFAEEDFGKPYITSYRNVHFNISHTDGYCAVAVSDVPVGVDIQFIKQKPNDGLVAIAKKYFSEYECDIQALNDDPALFYRLWTAKESAIKCTGEGISAGIRRYVFPNFNGRTSFDDMFFTSFDNEDYAMTVCAFTDEEPAFEFVSDLDIQRENGIMSYRKATETDLERIWDMNIQNNPYDSRWIRWKEQYIGYNKSGNAVSFVVVDGDMPVGEVTLIISPECKAVKGRPCLADGERIGNVNALRIKKAYEGLGHVSALMRVLEAYAKEHGFTRLTIGVEAQETRNLAIYLHWGYTKFVYSEVDEGELILYYAKEI